MIKYISQQFIEQKAWNIQSCSLLDWMMDCSHMQKVTISMMNAGYNMSELQEQRMNYISLLLHHTMIILWLLARSLMNLEIALKRWSVNECLENIKLVTINHPYSQGVIQMYLKIMKVKGDTNYEREHKILHQKFKR